MNSLSSIAAMVTNPRGLADLEDALAFTQYRLEQSSDAPPVPVPHEEVVAEARRQSDDWTP